MKLQRRLSLIFTGLFAVLLTAVLTSIYFIIAQDWQNNFKKQLEDRAYTVGHNYLAQDNFSKIEFDEVLRKLPRTLPKEKIRIYDIHFKPVFIKENTSTWNENILGQVVRKKSLFYKEGHKYVVGIYYIDNSGDYIVMAEAQNTLGEKSLQELRKVMLISLLIALVICVVLGEWFSYRCLKPIKRINQRMEKIQANSLGYRIPVEKESKNEITLLSTTINDLLERLQNSFESQQSFVSNASHELKTPIASLLGNAEIALRKDRDTEEYKDILEGVHREATRMDNIVSDLLMLSQLEHSNYPVYPVALEEFIWKITDQYMGDASGIRLNIDIKNPDRFQTTFININSSLMELAMTNLISNAYKFSQKDVEMIISINDSFVSISIIDQGIGIAPQDLEKITRPFYRCQNAYGIKGFGLGLSLCSKIMTMNKCYLSFKSVLEKGTTVIVEIPVNN
ncbi:HAMP domain-containing sensor histidine kinase [Elizabethkingia meningoseptica]|uniref:HAMP domain-containing sensor histidine kinase n=1 Tax=Elizabethkingia meningoseptica TaxID=238 RepID=UPI0023B0DB6C|nr:HAMP domain-containing sensor histidine kinase [Elizabethkingia meningoseptica]MDE5493582.1 HAMP domain-containing histidine kinase [Elizabethkingia meningoseptica]